MDPECINLTYKLLDENGKTNKEEITSKELLEERIFFNSIGKELIRALEKYFKQHKKASQIHKIRKNAYEEF